MTSVGIFDAPALVVLGISSAVLFKRRLRTRSVNWYLFLTLLWTGLFWINLVTANLTPLGYWAVVESVVSVPPAVGLLYGLSYPLWFRFGGEVGFLLVGRQPDQGGLIWAFRLEDGTEPIEPSWNVNEDVDRECQSTEDE